MSVIEETWDIQLDLNAIEQNSLKEFEINVKCLQQHILDLLEDSFKIQKYRPNGNTAQTNDDELKSLTEQNKVMRHEIETKIEELSKQKVQYENYKKDQKLLSQEIKETHEAFLMAKKYYKKFFKMYYTIEARNGTTQTIFIQFFTEAKKESENYSVRLLRDVKTGCYQLISVTPKLPGFKELQKVLQDTNDVPGALCCIRQTFMNMKKNKKLH